MKMDISAASTRDRERMRIVRAAFSSEALDHPGGSRSVSLGAEAEGAGVDSRSSTGKVPAVLEASWH